MKKIFSFLCVFLSTPIFFSPSDSSLKNYFVKFCNDKAKKCLESNHVNDKQEGLNNEVRECLYNAADDMNAEYYSKSGLKDLGNDNFEPDFEKMFRHPIKTFRALKMAYDMSECLNVVNSNVYSSSSFFPTYPRKWEFCPEDK